jgi:hypothetical protein
MSHSAGMNRLMDCNPDGVIQNGLYPMDMVYIDGFSAVVHLMEVRRIALGFSESENFAELQSWLRNSPYRSLLNTATRN